MDKAAMTVPSTMAPAEPTAATMQKQDHWLIQVVGGLTLANTIVSSLAVFYLLLAYKLT